jgi:DNA-binding transcriptional MerR regulator
MEKAEDIKYKQLKKRFQDKKKDIEDVSEQITETNNAEHKNKLERQLTRLYKELKEIEQDMVEISKSLTPSTNTNKNFTKKPIPPLLPHLCDRTEQKSQIESAYNNFKKQNSYRSLVFIIHGDEKQSHESFLTRMKEDILPHSLESMSCNFREHFLEWPAKFKPLNNDELQTRLLKDLYQKIFKNPSVDEDKLKNYFVKLSNEELIFYTSLTTKNWQEQGFKILDNLLNFWRYLFNENIIQKELIIVIFIKYKNQGKKSNIIEWIKSILNLKNNHRTNKKIRNHLDLLKANKFNDLLIIPVDELESVTKEEVDDWTNYDQVRDVINQAKFHQLKLKINNIFENSSKSKDSIPMMELEDYLLHLLEDLT